MLFYKTLFSTSKILVLNFMFKQAPAMPAKFQKKAYLLLLLILVSLASRASAGKAQPDTTHSDGIKSYFLLQLNLDTDPVDVQNYLNALLFKNQFQAFARYFSTRISPLENEQAVLMQWAISDALNGNLDQSSTTLDRLLQNEAVLADKELLSGIYKLKSQMMELKGNFQKAVLIQQKILELATQNQNSSETAHSLMQLGKLKSKQKLYAEADNYLLKQALLAFSRLKDGQNVVVCYREIADKYIRQELYTQARWFYVQSLILARKINDQDGIIAALIELGQLKYDVADFQLAYADWIEAEQLAITKHDLAMLLKLKFSLALASKQSNDLKNAKKYAMEFEQLKDILLNPVL